VYVSACLYEETGLHRFQAAHDVFRSLDRLTPAEQNEVLVGVAKLIEKAIELNQYAVDSVRWQAMPPCGEPWNALPLCGPHGPFAP
jgi:hypothetical protein